MYQFIFYCLSFSLLQMANAQDGKLSANDIGGAWVRVGEGCRMLSEKEMLSLPYNGGGNSARRRMMITFTEDKFEARFQPSLRCEEGYSKKESVDFKNETIFKTCEPEAQRAGQLTYLPGERIELQTEGSCLPSTNPWGCREGDSYKAIRIGSTLALTSSMDWDCGIGNPFYIYFIPLPMM